MATALAKAVRALEEAGHKDLARELDEEASAIASALSEARPYVFNRIIPPGREGHDWRSETAREVLGRVDAALAITRA